MRWVLFMPLVFGVTLECAPWARGERVEPAASGLVGQWAAARAP